MPAIDVLAAAVHRLFPTFVDQASAAHPMLDHLFGPENMEDMNTGAPYWEASFRVQGPGAATHIVNGNEIMPGQKDDITLRARVDPARVIYNYDLPEKDYAEAQWNPDKAVNLVEEYDKAAIDEIFDALDYQLQIVVHSRKLDIDPYLLKIRTLEDAQENELLKLQMTDYRSFITELVQLGDIMTKSFYVAVPYSPLSDKRRGFFDQKLFITDSRARKKLILH